MEITSRNKLRKIRAGRSRGKTIRFTKRPRLVVYKSARYIELQLIDDNKQHTLIGVNTKSKEARVLSPQERINWLAQKISDYMTKNKLNALRFDRSGYPYSGNIKKIVDSIREKGITI
ncbi:MAG TPA: 50S ribosomal protein L18 [bacterium]|jgi:large subunit ribosomal protein L18|nr:50S ribosomal protein L18 [bacterium]